MVEKLITLTNAVQKNYSKHYAPYCIQGCQMFEAHEIVLICFQNAKSWDKEFNKIYKSLFRVSIELNIFF